MKGTKFSRLLFQLQPKTHRTEEIDVGLLLPTPKAMEAPSASWENRKPNSKFKPGVTLTDLKVWGMLPTPNAAEGYKSAKTYNPKSQMGSSLSAMSRSGMLPTPTAMDSTNATATMKSTQVKEGSMHSVTLTRAMSMGMLPTPVAGEYRDTGEAVKTGNFKQMNLTRTIAKDNPEWTGKTSQLNPRFVAEMMGFPPNWTELPFQSGEQNPSKDTAMP
jgi:hypothetical protein